MLKITKGLKKKKKGKKSKHKEEELFTAEELEAYRREHQQQQEASGTAEATGNDDEWKKFQALTADIDSALKKTQGDLDRIKSTSFFQRVPPPSEQKKAKQLEEEQQHREEHLSAQAEVQQEKVEERLGIVEVSESESEEEEVEDDIFDTSFVEAVESGEVKLAYIPESPTKEDFGGDDPFDTSIAERAILGPAYGSKGKKLVPLGAAVEVLTGRVELPTCAVARKPSPRRYQQRNLLLDDLDTNGNTTEVAEVVAAASPEPAPKSLLDDDSLPLDDAPIDLAADTLIQAALAASEEAAHTAPPVTAVVTTNDILSEFDVIANKPNEPEPDEDDDEFDLLAAESAKKPIQPVVPAQANNHFQVDFNDDVEEDDPFDTTFAENILPGKAELKIIEDEILNQEVEEIKVAEKFNAFVKSNVSIHVTNPTGDRESISSLDRCEESGLNSLQPIHRDLLGGSNTDLSKIGDEPICPNQSIEDALSEYSDPFDTSIVDQVSAPGQAELKFLEKELLGDVVTFTVESQLDDDDDFNPREDEEYSGARKPSRPDLLEINSVKSVAFALPSPNIQPDLLSTGQEAGKHKKPLTPYYVRDNSIPEQPFEEEGEEALEDPFDTSFVAQLAPGKAELKLLENEFVGPEPSLKHSLSDPDFNPREEAHEVITKQVKEVKLPALELPTKLTELVLKEEVEVPKPDLLAVQDDVAVKVLTPAVEKPADFDLDYTDPFDTSIANNILPGKTELKLLENELIHTTTLKRDLTDPDFNPRSAQESQPVPVISSVETVDILDAPEAQVPVKPLTPVPGYQSIEVDDSEIDPFDTSIADNIAPGRAELKILESELI